MLPINSSSSFDETLALQMACFLVTAWEAFAHLHGKTIWELPVEFTDVNVVQPVRADRDEDVTLWVITDNSNHFQACCSPPCEPPEPTHHLHP